MSTEIAVLGLPVTIANPIPVVFSAGTLTWTQSVVALAAGVHAPLVAANPNRKALRWMNVGLNPMTVVPGAGPAVAGQGMAYDPPTAAEHQGGNDSFPEEVSQQAFDAISTLGTTVIVWEAI